MEDEQYPQGAYPPVVPPTTPGALPEATPVSKWPSVLGVISVVLGVLGVLGGVWGMVGMTVMARFMPAVPPEVKEEMERMHGWTIASSALGLAVALLLLVAGIGLTTRRRWGVPTAKIWAVIKMVLVVFGIAMSWHMMDTSSASNRVPAGSEGFVSTVQTVSLLFALVWGWALPVFMLVWLGRAKIKAETSTWK